MTGVYTSKDFGDSWEQKIDDSGLFSRLISSFTESINGYIFAGTKSSYCYRTISSSTGIPQPEPKITVTGKTSFCDGYFCILDVGEGWLDYKWSNGSKSRFDTVWVEGNYWLSAFDSLGMKVYSDTIKITVYPKPAKPRILFNGEILFCSIEAANYRWYFQDVLIDGANEKTYIPEKEGWYRCEVISEYTCTNISEQFLVEFPISINESNFEFQIYPNPSNDLIHIITPKDKEYSLSINDNLGVVVWDKKIHGSTLVDVSDLTVGFYILKISDDSGITTKKLLINR
jgi:hypothetical protein